MQHSRKTPFFPRHTAIACNKRQVAVNAHVRAAPAGLKVFINRYLDTENQLIPLFNLAGRVLFCMLMCWPRASSSCEHLQKSGFNEFFNAAAVNTLFTSAICKTDCSVSSTLDR